MTNKGTDGVTGALGSFDFQRILGIADALPMPLALLDQSERYLFCNRELCEFLERPRSEILGRRINQVIGKVAYEVRKPLIAAALVGERQWFAAEYDHPSRGTVALQTEYLPQVEADGSISGIVILVTDVTEQRVAERALRESEARFRRIANNAPVIMWVTRLDRHREFVNDAYLTFTGVARDQVNAHVGATSSTPMISNGWWSRAWLAKPPAGRSPWRLATSARTVSTAGCARFRARASGRTES
jgi:PAS domain S-box-containing protein